MVANLVISGGPLHDFAASSSVLVDLLAAEGVRSTVVEDPHDGFAALLDEPDAWDLVTVNGLHCRLDAPRHADLRERWSFTLTDAEAEAIDRHVRAGGGLLACHTAVICFDAHPRWASCVGATWSWERSMHPPLGPVLVEPTAAGAHQPITSGVPAFTTVDEVYCDLDPSADLVPLLTSPHEGVDHPVLWARSVGAGRVVTDLLGHDAEAMAHPTHVEVLRRAARWLTRSPQEERLDG